MTIKAGYLTTGNMIWPGELPFALFTTLGRVLIWKTPKEAYNPKCLVPAVNHGEGSVKAWAAILQYSVGPLHGQITAIEYMGRFGNQLHPMIHTFFFSDDAVFKDGNAPNHTTGTVQSQCEEHEGELQHLPWPAQSSLNYYCGQF
jgi:hypothetical protein